MKMNAQTVAWLIFLAIIKDFSCALRFTLEATHLTATEGSCIKIKCTVDDKVNVDYANWFWIKNVTWHEGHVSGSFMYSTNNILYPVSPNFAERVKYVGSPPSNWNNYHTSKDECSILICNLTKADSGKYYFRYEGKGKSLKWITKPLSLTVTENPCPVTFEKLPVVIESGRINVICSTSSSCPSNPQIVNLTQLASIQTPDKRTTVSLPVVWQDDGKEISCQAQANKDKYLIRNIRVTVEYSPKNILAKIMPTNIVERKSVTLSCSAKGNPDPAFTWFKNEVALEETRAVWDIPSIGESYNGQYHCEAENKHGTSKSDQVNIHVTYVPEVKVTSRSPAYGVKQGDKMDLTCEVTRSNPQPTTYGWFKNGIDIGRQHLSYLHVERIEPEDGGFYTCQATNTVGTGKSKPLNITVEYGPRKTNISIHERGDSFVGVDHYFEFNCNTDANPAPTRYSWYRYNNKTPIDSSRWKSKTTETNKLVLDRVQRADEACYVCNATNIIHTGEDSEPKCIQVLYPPTNPMLSMNPEVTEGQILTIKCTVESFPPSKLTLMRTHTSTPQSSEWSFTQPENDSPPNTLQHTFEVTSTHTGFYTCHATNSKGSNISQQRELVVKYRPKDVTIEAEPALVVNENKPLTLHCSARSHPPVTSVIWMKMTDGKSEIIWRSQTFSLKSVRLFDRGLYRCTARNEIGTGDSQQAEVKVKYAPKQTNIIIVAEQQQRDGTRSMTLSCSSHSYPPVTQYSWYKVNAEERHVKVYAHQNYTVNSEQPGVYYCVAQNEINQRSSDPLHVFDRSSMKILFIFLFLFILLVTFLIVFVYRHKKKKSIQQGTTNTASSFGFLGWWNGARTSNLMNEPSAAEPSRSMDDQLRRPNAQRCQPCPDSTPAANIDSVYSTVNLPARKQGPSAQKPIGQQGGHTQDDSHNYASLHFENKKKKKRAEDDVSKQNPLKKNEERLDDYENISTAHTAISLNPLKYDSGSSDDDFTLNYSEVSFKAMHGRQRADRDSSSSDEEETQYSLVKI